MKYYNHGTWNDRWIAETVFPNKTDGFFVEVGVGDGVNGSTTYHLEKNLNWGGILVEPYPFWVGKMSDIRPNSTVVDCCASSKDGLVDYFEFTTRGMEGFSFAPELSPHHQHWIGNKALFDDDGFYTNWIKLDHVDSAYKIIRKQSTTLENILDRAKAPNVIDYLSIDVEGAELSLLENFPFHKFRFRAISIERDMCRELLIKNGYIESFNPFSEIDCEFYFLSSEMIND
jgi:hypothetical protein